MPNFPPPVAALPIHIHSWSRYGPLFHARSLGGSLAAGSGAWSSANLAIYLPFILPWAYPVARLWWTNGSAAGANWDIGIYTAAGEKVVSTGSTAGSGNSAPQYVTLPVWPLWLPAGMYYWGVSHSANTANQAEFVALTIAYARASGVLQEASALPLPATMTPATLANALCPLVGMTRTDTGF